MRIKLSIPLIKNTPLAVIRVNLKKSLYNFHRNSDVFTIHFLVNTDSILMNMIVSVTVEMNL